MILRSAPGTFTRGGADSVMVDAVGNQQAAAVGRPGVQPAGTVGDDGVGMAAEPCAQPVLGPQGMAGRDRPF